MFASCLRFQVKNTWGTLLQKTLELALALELLSIPFLQHISSSDACNVSRSTTGHSVHNYDAVPVTRCVVQHLDFHTKQGLPLGGWSCVLQGTNTVACSFAVNCCAELGKLKHHARDSEM